MLDETASGADRPTERIIQQRIRNRVIEYLGLAASFDEQREYERNVPIAHVPYEVINQWGDNFPQGPEAEFERSTAFPPDEIAAVTEFHTIWNAVAKAIPDDWPTLEAVQAMPAWDRLRRAAASAGEVFARRGTMPEDHGVS